MRFLRFALLLAALPVVLAACGGGGSGSGNLAGDVVALVDGQEIPSEQLDALMSQAERSYKSQKREFPKAGTVDYQTLQSQAIKLLIQRVEFAQEAKGLGVVVTDKQVEDRLAQIKKQYFGGSDKRYLEQLSKQGLTDEQVRADVRAQLVTQAIFDKITAKEAVTDTEIEQYYFQHAPQYTSPQTREVRHILVKQKELADDIYAQLEAGGDFEALAKKYSQDPGSKSLGGKLTITRGQTVAPFDRTAFALRTGELSKPVKTQYGWHVIEAVKPAKPRQSIPLKDVRGSIRQQLLQEKRSNAMAKWIEEINTRYCDGKISYQAGFKPNPDPCAPSDAQAR